MVLVVARVPQGAVVASWKGDLLVCLGVLSWVLYTLLARAILKNHSSLALTMATFSIGTVLVVPLALWEREPLQSVPPSAWGALAYLILFASVIAFFRLEHRSSSGRPHPGVDLQQPDPGHGAAVGSGSSFGNDLDQTRGRRWV
ncbi:MAG: DMT family transporter [Candidatus Manganitrophus sp.]|nr:DMT family transporter [Candidatus Manganitrophus sp.]